MRTLPFVGLGVLAVFVWAAAGWFAGLLIVLVGSALGAAIAYGTWRDHQARAEAQAAAFRASVRELPASAFDGGADGPAVQSRLSVVTSPDSPDSPDAPDPPEPEPAPVTSGSASAAAAPDPAFERSKLPELLSEIRLKAEIDLPGALEDVDALRATHPTSPAVLALATRLHLAAGHADAELASEAVRTALRAGAMALAADLIRETWELRERLHLDADTLSHLGRVLWKRDDYVGAAWALERAAAQEAAGGDDLTRDLIAVASGARREDDPELALHIYDRLLARHPDSPYAPWLRTQADALRRRTPGRPRL